MLFGILDYENINKNAIKKVVDISIFFLYCSLLLFVLKCISYGQSPIFGPNTMKKSNHIIRITAIISVMPLLMLFAASAIATETGSEHRATALLDALAVAYENNPQIKAERERLKSIDENMPQAYSGWMPSVTASHNRSRQNIDNDVFEGRVNPYTSRIAFEQNIFSGGDSIAAVKQAKNLIRAGRERLRDVEQQIMLQAITAYVDVVRAQEVLNLSINNKAVLEEQLEATQDRFELGETTRTDVAQAESRLAQAESDRILAEGNLVAAKSEYKRIFVDKPAAEIGMPILFPILPDNFDKALEAAQNKSPALRRVEYEFDAAEYAVKREVAGILPSVNISGEAKQSRHLSPAQGGKEDNETIGLNVVVPLYQSGAEYSRVRQAKKEASNTRYRMQDTRNAVVDQTTKAWREVETSRGNISATSANVKAAVLALEGVKQEQEVGSRTVLDVLDAEQELFQAKVNHVSAKRNEIIAVYSLLAAMGELSAADLKLDVDYYNPEEHYDDVKYKPFGF